MKRATVAMLLAAGLVMTACGGQTALEVRIEPANSIVAGRDFNAIRVQVSDIDGAVHGETYPVTELTEKPYRVFVLAGYENNTVVRIHVQLLKDGTLAADYDRVKPSVKFIEGEMEPVVFTF